MGGAVALDRVDPGPARFDPGLGVDDGGQGERLGVPTAVCNQQPGRRELRGQAGVDEPLDGVPRVAQGRGVAEVTRDGVAPGEPGRRGGARRAGGAGQVAVRIGSAPWRDQKTRRRVPPTGTKLRMRPTTRRISPIVVRTMTGVIEFGRT